MNNRFHGWLDSLPGATRMLVVIGMITALVIIPMNVGGLYGPIIGGGVGVLLVESRRRWLTRK